MNVNVNRKTHAAVVSLGKRERDILSEAAGILGRLGKHADYERATDAAIEVTVVLQHFAPQQKELPLEKDEQKTEPAEPASGGTEAPVQVGTPDVPSSKLPFDGEGTARSRKRTSAPHGIV